MPQMARYEERGAPLHSVQSRIHRRSSLIHSNITSSMCPSPEFLNPVFPFSDIKKGIHDLRGCLLKRDVWFYAFFCSRSRISVRSLTSSAIGAGLSGSGAFAFMLRSLLIGFTKMKKTTAASRMKLKIPVPS